MPVFDGILIIVTLLFLSLLTIKKDGFVSKNLAVPK